MCGMVADGSAGNVRDGIEPTRMPRMATGNAPQRQPATAQHTEPADGLERIVGARRMKSARRTEHRAHGPLIKSDQECGNAAHRSFTFSLAERGLRLRNGPAPSARIMRRPRAEGMTFARHPVPECLQARPQLGGCGIPRPVPGADDDIDGRQLVLMQPERFANDPADAVALHAAARGANRDGKTKTRPALVVPEQNHTEKSIAKSPSARVDRFEVRLAAQAPLRGKGKP